MKHPFTWMVTLKREVSYLGTKIQGLPLPTQRIHRQLQYCLSFGISGVAFMDYTVPRDIYSIFLCGEFTTFAMGCDIPLN
jgi:hypothetical protein